MPTPTPTPTPTASVVASSSPSSAANGCSADAGSPRPPLLKKRGIVATAPADHKRLLLQDLGQPPPPPTLTLTLESNYTHRQVPVLTAQKDIAALREGPNAKDAILLYAFSLFADFALPAEACIAHLQSTIGTTDARSTDPMMRIYAFDEPEGMVEGVLQSDGLSAARQAACTRPLDNEVKVSSHYIPMQPPAKDGWRGADARSELWIDSANNTHLTVALRWKRIGDVTWVVMTGGGGSYYESRDTRKALDALR